MNQTIEKTNIENISQNSDDILHKYLLKKIKREVRTGQSVLHISNKHNQITDLLENSNNYLKIDSLEALADVKLDQKSKLFTYVIADLDMPALDNFDAFLHSVAPLIIRPGLLIVVASNICSGNNPIDFLFGNEPKNFSRPNRAVPPAFLRNHLLENGYYVKNRFWEYDEKLLIMADIPKSV